MKIDILTLFPEMFDALKNSITGRAINNELLQINLVNIRDFADNKHKQVDDVPYGGGAGMVMKPDVVYFAYKSVAEAKAKVIYLTPQGKTLNQKKVIELSKEKHLILLCGHYEGIDERVIEEIQPEEISIGDYVLTGGEIPAMALIDAVSRYIEGVINKDSIEEESFSNKLLEYPQYTRPEIFLNRKVPEVLLSRTPRKYKEVAQGKVYRNNQEEKTRFIRLGQFIIKRRRFRNGHNKINRAWTNEK